MTTALWILVAFACALAALVSTLALARALGGGPTTPAELERVSGETRYEADNRLRLNLGAVAAAFLLVGGIAGLATALALT